MAKPKQDYKIRFVSRENDTPQMPIIVTEQGGTRVGSTGSFNSFANKDAVNKYLAAQRTMAKHFGLERRFEEALPKFKLTREISYSSELKF